MWARKVRCRRWIAWAGRNGMRKKDELNRGYSKSRKKCLISMRDEMVSKAMASNRIKTGKRKLKIHSHMEKPKNKNAPLRTLNVIWNHRVRWTVCYVVT